MKATAVLLNYKRPRGIAEIRKHLLTFPEFIDEIIVWDNSIANVCGYGRYLAALEAKNDVIYTQDDDCIIYNIPELFSIYDGTKIVNNMSPTHLSKYKRMNHTLPGWGMIFDRAWIGCLNIYIKKYGMDELFFRDTGRLFTGLYGSWESILAKKKNLSSVNGEMALCRQPSHNAKRKQASARIKILMAEKK